MYFGLDIFLEVVFEIYVVWEHGVDKTMFSDIEVHVLKKPILANFCYFFFDVPYLKGDISRMQWRKRVKLSMLLKRLLLRCVA